MNKDNNQLSLVNKIKNIILSNVKIIITSLSILFLIFIVYQYYIYYLNNKVLKISKLYEQTISEDYSIEIENKLKKISEDNGAYGILASLELINKSIENKDYNYAYTEYIRLLKNNSLKNIYNNIIALHGAYNLIDYLPSNDINNFLSYIDDDFESLIGHKYEIKFLLSIKNNNSLEQNRLSEEIFNNNDISNSIKERVRKINDFEKFK